MSDEHLRELERRWKETGSVEDEAAFVLERIRGGALSRLDVEVAAAHGGFGERHALSTLPDRLLVIHFWATWNRYDDTMTTTLTALQTSIEGWLLHPVDIDQEQDFASACQIMNVPTLIGFRRGKEVSRMVGMGDVETWLLELLTRKTQSGER